MSFLTRPEYKITNYIKLLPITLIAVQRFTVSATEGFWWSFHNIEKDSSYTFNPLSVTDDMGRERTYGYKFEGKYYIPNNNYTDNIEGIALYIKLQSLELPFSDFQLPSFAMVLGDIMQHGTGLETEGLTIPSDIVIPTSPNAYGRATFKFENASIKVGVEATEFRPRNIITISAFTGSELFTSLVGEV